MSQIAIRGGQLVTPMEVRMTDLVIEDQLIVGLGPVLNRADKVVTIDASGCYVTPGLIDLQVNGGPGCDFWGDPGLADVAAFAEKLSRAGVTAFLPTLITDDLDHLCKNIDFLEKQVGVGEEQLKPRVSASQGKASAGAAAVQERHLPVRMPGIHLEGPCISPEKPGVHPKEQIAPLSIEVLKKIVRGPVKLMTLAPEKDPTFATLKFLKEKNVVVSIGHSFASFEESEAAFDHGVSMMTHTFNALPSIHHRAPGAVTAALLDERVDCCIICDGDHVSPAAAKLIVKMKGVNKTILVTDIAYIGTSQGGLVGSSIMLDEAVRNVVSWGLMSFQDAIIAASYNPARAMRWEHAIGQLAPGKLADVVIWDKETLAIKHVLSGGEQLF
jgi:N-acetylglucosamine-6-phosphate deacetylase